MANTIFSSLVYFLHRLRLTDAISSSPPCRRLGKSHDQPRPLCIRRRPAMPGGAGTGQDPGGDVLGGAQDAPGPVLRPSRVPGVHGAGGELAGVQGGLHHAGGHRGEHALTLPIPKGWETLLLLYTDLHQWY